VFSNTSAVIFKESIYLDILDDCEKCLFKKVEEGDLSGLKNYY